MNQSDFLRKMKAKRKYLQSKYLTLSSREFNLVNNVPQEQAEGSGAEGPVLSKPKGRFFV